MDVCETCPVLSSTKYKYGHSAYQVWGLRKTLRGAWVPRTRHVPVPQSPPETDEVDCRHPTTVRRISNSPTCIHVHGENEPDVLAAPAREVSLNTAAAARPFHGYLHWVLQACAAVPLPAIHGLSLTRPDRALAQPVESLTGRALCCTHASTALRVYRSPRLRQRREEVGEGFFLGERGCVSGNTLACELWTGGRLVSLANNSCMPVAVKKCERRSHCC